MTPKLLEWLRREFCISNHNKYRHLFGLWVANITLDQVAGFEKQMYNQENNVLGIMK